MKKIALLFASLLTFTSTFAANQNLSIKINLERAFSHAPSQSIANSMQTTADNHDWTIVQDANGSNHNTLLLSKIVGANDKQATMQFMVIDLSKQPRVISNPKLIVSFNQPANMTIANKHDKLTLSVLAHA